MPRSLALTHYITYLCSGFTQDKSETNSYNLAPSLQMSIAGWHTEDTSEDKRGVPEQSNPISSYQEISATKD